VRIDLHTHSIRSDGSDEPAALIEKATDAGVDVVALTDHDTTAGWTEALETAERSGKIRLVLGVEFSVTNESRGYHLLGYRFDPLHPSMAEILAKAENSREDRVERLFALLESKDLGVDRGFVTGLAGGIPSRKHMAAGMVQAGHVADEDEAFARYLNEGMDAYVQRYRPSIEEAVRVIAEAGGVSVIAHPRDTRRGPGISDERFAELKRIGLNGIEVDHQAHPIKVRQELRQVAADLDLPVTGSSDHHGNRRSGYDLGCNTTDPDVAAALLGSAITGP
jgi:predicted metal-dependent phosphoesterase TrpH